MTKARLPKSKTDKEIWNGIKKKASSQQLEQIKATVKHADIFINRLKRQFSLNKKVFHEIESHINYDWSQSYTENSHIFVIIVILSEIIPNQQLSELISSMTQNPFTIEKFVQTIKNLPIPKPQKERKMSQKEEAEFLVLYRMGMLDTICLLNHNLHISQLIEQAKRGDDSALFKSVVLDKNLTTADWLIERIRKENILGNQKFFQKLGEALSQPIEAKDEHAKIKIMLFLSIIWSLQLDCLTDPELFFLIEKYDLYIFQNVDSFKIYRNRLGFKRKSTVKIRNNVT